MARGTRVGGMRHAEADPRNSFVRDVPYPYSTLVSDTMCFIIASRWGGLPVTVQENFPSRDRGERSRQDDDRTMEVVLTRTPAKKRSSHSYRTVKRTQRRRRPCHALNFFGSHKTDTSSTTTTASAQPDLSSRYKPMIAVKCVKTPG
jgi:hypothetical protein